MGFVIENCEEYYVVLFCEVYKKVKEVVLEIFVLGGVVYLVFIGWFWDLMEFGVVDYMDGVVIYLYVVIVEYFGDEIEVFQEIFKWNGFFKFIYVIEVGIEIDDL